MRKAPLVLVFILFLLVLALTWAWPQLDIITGYAAKKACSYTFISERDMTSIMEIDLADFPLSLVQLEVLPEKAIVRASILGVNKSTAVYRNGLGCTLLQGEDDYKIQRTNSEVQINPYASSLPKKNTIEANHLSKAFELGMDPLGEWQKKTTALLVVHKDSIVHEAYTKGFDSETEILGWSMTKSVCNLLIGMMVNDGLIDLSDKVLYPAWESDDRKKITIENLLRMDSGLEWTEEYKSVCDITQGLFKEEDFVSFARAKKLETAPGQVWEYASGSSNLLSGIMRRKFESYQDYLSYPQLRLFDKLGIRNAYIETDEAGNFLMSSYMYAKTQDWAKLGLLYLHKGKWNGEQLVPADYIEWSVRPGVEPTYGAHVWLNTNQALYPSAPADAYNFSGFEGQYVVVIPSMELVVVRMGLSKGPPFDMDAVLREVFRGLQLAK